MQNRIVFIYSPGCPHCQRLKPELEQLAQANTGRVRFDMVDASTPQGAQVARALNVDSVPVTLAVGPDNRIRARLDSAMPIQMIATVLQAVTGPQVGHPMPA